MALCAGATLLLIAFGHEDDIDALYYLQMADHIRASCDWWRPSWPELPAAFSDHLPTGLWIIAAGRGLLGAVGYRVFMAAVAGVYLWLIYALAKRHERSEIGLIAVMCALLTEAFSRALPAERFDTPFLLAWVGAIYVADLRRRHTMFVSGLCVACALLIRPPPTLALFILVPIYAWWVRQPGVALRQALSGLVVFALPVVAAPLLFHLADRVWGPGDWWQRYLDSQVLASLTGSRGDGRSSHWAPLLTVASRFWPGFALVLVAGWRTLRTPPDRFTTFLWLWSVIVVAGFSLGRRHIWTHTWPVYAPLFLLAAEGVWTLLRHSAARRLWPWLLHPVLPVLTALALGGAAIARGFLCDAALVKRRLGGQVICPASSIVTEDGAFDWFVAHQLVTHLGVHVAQRAEADLMRPKPPGCLEIAGLVGPIPVPTGWTVLSSSRRYTIISR